DGRSPARAGAVRREPDRPETRSASVTGATGSAGGTGGARGAGAAGAGRPRRPRGRAARALDRDLPPSRLRHRDRHLEHAVLEGGLRLRLRHLRRHGDRAAEAAVQVLGAVVPLALVLEVTPPLALDDDALVGQLDPHVLRLDARQLRADDEVVAAP